MKQLFVSIGFMLILTSCTSYRTFKISNPPPNGRETFWEEGREYFIYETDHFRFSVAFDSQTYNYIMFAMNIINISDENAVIDPCEFFIEGERLVKKEYLLDEDKFVPMKKCAMNPENVINNLDCQVAGVRRQQRTDSTVDMVFSLLDLTGTLLEISGKTNKTREEINDDRDERMERYLQDEERDRSREAEIRRLKSRKVFWQSKVIRKTTLSPGESLSGLVVFDSGFYNQLSLYLSDNIIIDLSGY